MDVRLPKFFSDENTVYDESGVPRQAMSSAATMPGAATTTTEKVNMSMESFFEREERISREKMKQFLDRTAQPRGVAALAASQAQQQHPAHNYVVGATAPPQSPVFALGAQLSQPNQQPQHHVLSPQELAAFQLPSAQRPASAAPHTWFDVGPPSATPREMRSTLFHFSR